MKIIERRKNYVLFENNIKVLLYCEYDSVLIHVTLSGNVIYVYDVANAYGTYNYRRIKGFDVFRELIGAIESDFIDDKSSQIKEVIKNNINAINMLNLLNELKELVKKYGSTDNDELIKQINSIKTRLEDYSTTLDNIKYDVNKLEKKL